MSKTEHDIYRARAHKTLDDLIDGRLGHIHPYGMIKGQATIYDLADAIAKAYYSKPTINPNTIEVNGRRYLISEIEKLKEVK